MSSLHRVQTRFREVADRVSGEYVQYGAGGIPQPAVRRVTARHRFTMARPPGAATTVPLLLAPFRNPRNVRIRIRPERWPTRILKRLGFIQDVVTGDAELDARFLLSATPESVLREILGRAPAREHLRAAGSVTARTASTKELVAVGAVVGHRSLPEGVDLLLLRASWGLPSADRLAAFFGLAEEILAVLDPAPEGEEPDRKALLARVREPATVVYIPGTDLALWDVGPERYAAARALGERGGEGALEALVAALEEAVKEDDDALAVAVTDGLAALGSDARPAVGPLAALLGRRPSPDVEGAVAEHAARALRRLGRGDLVAAFQAAVDGEPASLLALGLAGRDREGVVAALVEIVESGLLAVRPHAARTLGLLGAHEALPALRRASRAAGMRTRLTEAAREAMDAIRARASLPRPAAASEGSSGDTLPRPADPPGPRGDLPRPARPDGDT